MASTNLGSFEKSISAFDHSPAASRETRSRSRPEGSSCASSVIAGTWRNRRKASVRRCASVLAVQGNCAVQPSWASISLTNWPILPAAASACSCWMRMSEVLCS